MVSLIGPAVDYTVANRRRTCQLSFKRKNKQNAYHQINSLISHMFGFKPIIYPFVNIGGRRLVPLLIPF